MWTVEEFSHLLPLYNLALVAVRSWGLILTALNIKCFQQQDPGVCELVCKWYSFLASYWHAVPVSDSASQFIKFNM